MTIDKTTWRPGEVLSSQSLHNFFDIQLKFKNVNKFLHYKYYVPPTPTVLLKFETVQGPNPNKIFSVKEK